jgi:hypothetical protein
LTEYLHIKNWKTFQHYGNRRSPPWIKLHYEILASEDWVMLADASKLLMVACMVIGSRHEGRIPNNPAYIKRVAFLDKVPNLKPLIECGFLTETLAEASTVIAVASREKSRVEENRVEEKKVSKRVARAPASKKTASLPDDWQLDGPGLEYATARGLDDYQRDQAAVDFLEYYTEGDGLSKQRTELGWRQSWQRWVRTEPNFTRKGKGNGKQPLDLRQGARDVIAGIISYPNKAGGSPATPGDQPAAVEIEAIYLPGDSILVESGGDGGSHAGGPEDPVEIFPDSAGDNPAVRKGSVKAVGSEAGGPDQGSASPSGGDRRGSGQELEGVVGPEAPF